MSVRDFLAKHILKRSSLENPAVPLTFPVELQMDGLFGSTTDAGVRVSELTALSNSTVNTCVRIIAETLGQVPLLVYEDGNGDNEGGIRLASELPVFNLLNIQPNPWMDTHIFRETMQACVLLWGNAYAVIERDNAGRPIALWPRNPAKTHPMITEAGKLMYTTQDGMPEGQWQFWEPEDVIHIKGLGLDGLLGMSPVKYFMKNAIGVANAAESFGARFFGNGGRPGGILVYSGALTPENKEQIRKSWQEAQAGANQNRPAVLTGQWDWKEINVPPEEAQFLQTRKLQEEVICGMFRVPPHMAGKLERATNNNIEHQSLEFTRNCMMPWFSKWQTELKIKLLPKQAIGRNAAKKFFVKFDTSDLTMGDFKTTMDALSVGLLNGTYSVNDARKKLGMNPIEFGDLHTVQSQLTTLENLAAQAEAAMATAKKAVEEPAAAPATPDVTPDPTPIAEPEAEQNTAKLVAMYRTLFADAYNRTLVREKRDLKDISSIFEPLLTTIAEGIRSETARSFGVEVELGDIISDQIKAMSKRVDSWTTEKVIDELEKTVRSLRVAIYREAAIQKAKE